MTATAEKLSAPHVGAAVAARLSRTDDSPGKRMKERREELNLRQQDVADVLELSRAAYAQYETSSSKLRVDQAEVVARFLSTTPEWIAFGAGERNVVEEIAFDNGEFRHKGTWTFSEDWLRRAYGVKLHELRLIEVTQASPSMKVGDVAMIQRGVQPTAGVAEFAMVVDGELIFANVSKLTRSQLIRIHHGKANHDDVHDPLIVGKVVGRIGHL